MTRDSGCTDHWLECAHLIYSALNVYIQVWYGIVGFNVYSTHYTVGHFGDGPISETTL